MPKPLPIQKQDYPLLLSYCPDLRLMDPKERDRLADLLTLQDYPAGHTFFTPPRERPGALLNDPARRMLRIVVAGHVQLEHRFGEARGRRSCGPLELVGEESVIAWDEERRRSGGPPVMRPENLHATEAVWVLELPEERFAQAFPEGGTGLARIRVAQQVNALAPRAVEQLESSKPLGNVKSADLYHLLEGAEVLTPGEILVRRGQIATDFFILFDGRFTFTRPDSPPTILEAPAVAALESLIGDLPLDAELRAEGSSVLRLSGETFWQLFTIDADFQRAIVRTNAVAPRVLADMTAAGSSSLLLFLGSTSLESERPDVSRVLGKLTDLVGERIAAHLYDRVLVLHLLPAGSRARERTVRDFTEGFVGDALRDCPWIEHRWAPIDEGFGKVVKREIVVPAPARAGGVARSRAEVVLLDVSALDREEAIQGAFDLDVPCKVVHLSSVPGELPPLKFLVKGIPILHAGVLSVDLPATGIGHAMRMARATMDVASPGLGGRLEALGEGVTMVVESAAKSVTRLGESLLEGTRSNAEGGAAQAWSIGTVRVRFQGPLLDALPGFGEAPASFDDLGSRLPALGDPAVVRAATVHTFDHWARALTSRRVGLTLSGGGPYGVIHIPLLRRLIARKLPIDLVSGTSVGSSVGAYFAVLGEEGLDLFIDHALAMNLACLASIVSSAAFQAVVGYDLGPVPLIDTEIPFFPVVTDADIGIEWDLRHGSYALGVRASGSLPPLGPTIIGNRRYLDGGLVANVPVNVLRDEGAALIIASNAISSVSPSGRANVARFGVFQPIVEIAQELSLMGRLDDLRRMIPLIFRTVGDAQANAADVTYRPSYRDVSFWSSFSQADLKRGEQSPDLDRRVTELENRWRSLLRHPPSRVRIDAENNRLELLSPLTFTEQDQVDPSCLPILGEAAHFLGQRSEGLRITRLGVEVAAKSQVSADRRAQAVVSTLVQSAVDHARLTPKGVLIPAGSDAAEGVTFPILEQQLSDAEARRKLAELEARARIAERSALAKALTMGAEWHCRGGDLDLGRLLALEAAYLDPGPVTDAVLRHALARRGWTVRRLPGVKGLQQMAIRPDGRRLAAGSADGIVRLWDIATDTEGPRAERPLAEISQIGTADPGIAGVAWSCDGKLLATTGFDGNVNVYAVAQDDTMSLVFRGSSGTWSQWGLAFAPDDARLLGTSGGSRAKVAVWDTAAGVGGRAPVIVEHDGDVKRAAWSPDGALVAAGTDRGSLWVWSPTDQRPVPRRIAATPGPIADLDWCPKHRDRLAFASGNEARIVGLVEGGPETVLGGHSRAVRHVAFSPDGARLATASDDGSARIWSAEGRFLMNLRGDGGPLKGVAWHPEGRLVATFSEQGTAVIWDVESGEPVARLLGHEGTIVFGAFTPDARRFVTGSADATVRIWDPLASAQIGRSGHEGALHPKAPGLAIVGGSDGSVEVWDPGTGARVALLLAPDPVGPARVCIDKDGGLVAAIREGERALRVWRTGAWDAPLHVIEDSSDERGNLRLGFSPDGRLLAVKRRRGLVVWDLSQSPPTAQDLDCGEDGQPRDVVSFAWDPVRPGRLAASRWLGWGSVVLFDLAARDPRVAVLEGTSDGVWSVAFSPDGALLASGCNNGNAYVYTASDGALLGRIAHGSAVKCVAFSAEQGLLGTGDGGRSAKVFHVETKPFAARLVSAAEDHLDAIETVAWSPDGACFASGSVAGRVAVWRKVAGQETWRVAAQLSGHGGRVRSLSFSADGTSLLTTGDDGSALVHLTDFGVLIDAVGAIPGPAQMPLDDWLRFFGTSAPHRPSWPRPSGQKPQGKRLNS